MQTHTLHWTFDSAKQRVVRDTIQYHQGLANHLSNCGEVCLQLREKKVGLGISLGRCKAPRTATCRNRSRISWLFLYLARSFELDALSDILQYNNITGICLEQFMQVCWLLDKRAVVAAALLLLKICPIFVIVQQRVYINNICITYTIE